jgi:hypothetical protein
MSRWIALVVLGNALSPCQGRGRVKRQNEEASFSGGLIVAE